ncbi:MAG: hypothetical protein IT386_12985 [Deltaproteobacteria bacterium]|nr:hypothetical protein [Deltaproteobacteria bacterium]
MRRSWCAAVFAVSMLVAGGAASAEQRWVEAAGVARAEPGEGRGGPGRQAALRAALAEAVQQVAVELLVASETAAGKPPADPAALAERAARTLGGDPTIYVARYQIREDRGVQPRLLLADADAKAEYQLVVMAQVDVAKVRQKVGARAAPAAEEAAAAPKPPADEAAPDPEKPATGEISRVRLEIEQVASYGEYAAVRGALLGKLGARSAMPIELSRGRAVLDVESPVAAAELAGALRRALAGGPVGIEALPPAAGAPPEQIRVRIRSATQAIPPSDRLTR